MGLGGLEPPTSRLSGVRSDRLSYGPAPGAPRGAPLAVWSGEGTGGRRGRLFTPRGRSPRGDLRKEVIQPQVPLRLPCYDFTPVTVHSLGPCLLAVGSGTSGANDSHGVTGGVYKARERIHPCLLIRDY